MQVSVAKAKGVTVFTLTSDPRTNFPLICRLCYSPVCTVSQGMEKLVEAQSALGSVEITAGLFTISLSATFFSTFDGPYFLSLIGAPCWLGVTVSLGVLLSLVGGILPVVAVAFYCMDECGMWSYMCKAMVAIATTTSTLSCRSLTWTCNATWKTIMLPGLKIMFIAFAVLQFCTSVSTVVLCLKALS